jgi:hypothetical protein
MANEKQNGMQEAKAPREIKPRCPYCNSRPCVMQMTLSTFGFMPTCIFICEKCERIISVAPLPIPPEPPRQQRESSGIVIPGRGM